MASGMEEDQPAWAADVETYVSVDRASAVSDEDRDEAAGRIVQLLVSGALTFLDLLRGMETCLVTTDEPRRARGVLLLAECVAGYAGDDETVAGGARPLPGGAASLLSQYFASKLEDFAVLRAALAGCTALLRATATVDGAPGRSAPAVSHDNATEMADRFFDAVHVPSLVQADRQRSYQFLLALVSHPAAAADGPPLGSASPAEQIESVVAACDGEKDPRNVLLLCELWTALPRAFCGFDGRERSVATIAKTAAADVEQKVAKRRAAFASAAEELYDVVAAYFPVSFRPPPGDSVRVTREQLAATLRGAMCASGDFAPWAVPHVLESLAPDKKPQTLDDALATLMACGAAFGTRGMSPHVRNVWSRLRNLLLHPPAGPELTAEGTARWATRAFASEWGGAELVALALADPCLKDAAQALRGEGGDAMEVDGTGNGGGGCCGGSGEREGRVEGGSGGGCCGGSGDGAAEGAAAAAADVTRRGHALVAGAGRIIGAIAAAGPEPAAAAMSLGLAPLLDAAGLGPAGETARARPGAGPLGLVLATPAACGALDGALGGANAPSDASPVAVLGDVGARLVGLFAAAAAKRIEGTSALRVEEEKKPEPAAAAANEKEAEEEEEEEEEGSQDNGGILGVAGLRTLLSFPAGTGLPGEDGARAALNALVDASLEPDASAVDADLDPRTDLRVRAGEALAAAAASKVDPAVAAATVKTAVPRLCAACDGDAASLALAALARVSAASADARRVAVTTLWSRLGGARRPDPVWTKPLWKDFVDAMAGSVPKTASSGSGSVLGMLQSVALDPSTAAGGGEEDAAARDIAATMRSETAPGAGNDADACRLIRAATAALGDVHQVGVLADAAGEITSGGPCFRAACAAVAGLRVSPGKSTDFPNCENLVRRLVSRAVLPGGDEDDARSATEALSSLIHKLGASGALGPRSGLTAAVDAGLTGSLHAAAGVAAVGATLRALAARADPAAAELAADLVAALSSPSREVAAGAARAFGVAMSPGGGGPGLTRECHGSEKKLFRQRFFTQTVPAVMAAIEPSSRSGHATTNPDHRPAHLSALVQLARHAPISAVLQSGDSILPVLAEAINALADQSTPFADKDALAGGITMTAAFLSDPRGRDTLALHAEEHAGAIIGALCRIGSSAARKPPGSLAGSPTLSLVVRETALDALVAATSLPFSVVYPHRKAVERASVAALDDPKRVVRFAAARCREAWLLLGKQT